jgi:Phosphodiester glycosidase
MAATTSNALVGKTLLRSMRSSAMVYTDDDLFYLVMSGKTRMRVLMRTADEYFTTFVDREAKKLGMDVVVNGNYYDVNWKSKFWAGTWGTSSDADNSSPQGYLIDSQVSIGGDSRPQSFFVAQARDLTWTFGPGNPPFTGTSSAVGGVGPLIIKGQNYGDGNLYGPGAPKDLPRAYPPRLPSGQGTGAGADASLPTTEKGDPSPANARYLIQRNNNNFADFQSQGARRGKTVIAYASADDKVLVVHQPEGATTGIELEDLRDKLAGVGVDNAVFLDGGDSAMLWVNRNWYTSPAARKSYTNIVGVAFDIHSP